MCVRKQRLHHLFLLLYSILFLMLYIKLFITFIHICLKRCFKKWLSVNSTVYNLFQSFVYLFTKKIKVLDVICEVWGGKKRETMPSSFIFAANFQILSNSWYALILCLKLWPPPKKKYCCPSIYFKTLCTYLPRRPEVSVKV